MNLEDKQCEPLFHHVFVLLNAYFFSTGTFGQPEVDSVNSLAEKHQMTNFSPQVRL